MRAVAEILARLRAEGSARVTGLRGSADAYAIARLCEALSPGERPVVVVCADDARARALARDARFHLRRSPGVDPSAPPEDEADHGRRVEALPDVETSPYADVAWDWRGVARRLALLFRLRHGLGPDVLVAGQAALRRRTLARDTLEARSELVSAGSEAPRERLIATLLAAGYRRADLVQDPGAFAVRGGVLDVFVPLYRFPARLEYLGDTVESLRLFHPDSQRALRAIPDLFVHPVRETLRDGDLDRGAIVRAGDEAGTPSAEVRDLLARLDAGEPFFGEEALAPALLPRMEAPLDYLPAGATLWLDDPDAVAAAARADDDRERDAFAARRAERRVALPPEAWWAAPGAFAGALTARRRVEALRLSPERGGEIDAGTHDLSDLAAALRAARSSERPLAPLAERLRAWRGQGVAVLVQCTAPAQAERLRDLLDGYDLAPPPVAVGPLSAGFAAIDRVVVAEEEIFGPRARRRVAPTPPPHRAGTDLSHLHPGDLVVHEEHGIGRYHGLVSMEVGGVRADFLHLEYAGGDRLYLPIWRLGLVGRYLAPGAGEAPRLDRMGGETFERRKRKVKEEVRQLAEELLQLYARRRAARGHGYGPPDAMMQEFSATFPFEETPDQARAIDETLSDMAAERPMDRLVCGDVGFGKTEVALRAALRAVLGGRQAAVLAPTTLLCEQHLRTFRERLEGWPVRVEALSRFRARAEQAAIVRDLAGGKVDIAIGTHRLLASDVRFSDLGLVVIDEEQRFGVAHKERLVALRAEVDVLALTATPIPRTLHMALSGVRDLSIISSPPADRLSIRTVVARDEDALVRDAVRRELARGGQVFYVHNRIETLPRHAARVAGLVPEARVAAAHGRMAERELEKVMVAFVRGDLDVLVSTAIVESGLDIPRANTILIHGAESFGLADLYQLRGRVGRGRERAFCWLLVESGWAGAAGGTARPPVGAGGGGRGGGGGRDDREPGDRRRRKRPAVSDARRRIEALLRFSDVGSGFALATADLDIRGAGELLGARQSGQMAALGFDQYMRMLEEAVADLRGEPAAPHRDLDVRVDLPAFLPEEYVDDLGARLDLYRRLAEAPDDDAIAAVREELCDRYGRPPPEAETLLEVMGLKARARSLGAVSLEVGRARLALALSPDTPLSPARVADLVSRPGSAWRLTPDGRLSHPFGKTEADSRLRVAADLLRSLARLARPAARA